MPKSVFISYSHQQGPWVWDRLVPCLKAGGAEVLIDRERFEAGRALLAQMDEVQGSAQAHVLVLSPDYLASRPCRHEMKRAIDGDPRFENGTVIPLQRAKCDLPAALARPNPLYVDLRNDKPSDPWSLLLRACGADLGTPAPSWLAARDDARRYLERGQSVSLETGEGVAWRGLLEDLERGDSLDLANVNLDNPATISRPGLVGEILAAVGAPQAVPEEPNDLAAFSRALGGRAEPALLALHHFDNVTDRYDVELFRALRYLVMDERRLVLLAQSRAPFANLLPQDRLSKIDVRTVSLPARS